MAKKSISNKEVSKRAVSKKAVVKEETRAEKIADDKEVMEAPSAAKKKAPKSEQKKVVEVEEMDNFMKEGEVSIKRIALKIWDVVFWVLFVLLLCTWIVDFFRVKSDKNPLFCINKETIEFEDGTVEKCTGLGYKIYNYDRASLDNGLQFEPFFGKMKEPDNE